jgi:hypothetical protein
LPILIITHASPFERRRERGPVVHPCKYVTYLFI